MKRKRILSLLMAALIMLASVPAAAGESAGMMVRSAPLIRSDSVLDGMVRVYLSSIGNITSLDLTVVGSYSISGAYSLVLTDGQKVHVDYSTSTGQITVTVNGVSYPMGREVVFRRHQTDGESALKIAQANRPNNLYPGDLQLLSRASGNVYKLYPIVHVYIEYYLYGVVPYEMSSSWPIEALKAQAVAARTYTLNRMNGREKSDYDLVDTSSDQVYNGYVGTQTNATRAVDATRGIVIMNGGKLSGTYYTASNGGQTEAVANAWGSTAYPYLGVKDDPFDRANPNTNKRKLVIYSNFSNAEQNATFSSLMTAKVQSSYGSSARIINITSVTPHTPKYAAPSRLYTKIDFGVTLADGRNVTLTFDIFGELEGPLSMSINSGKNELWYVERDGSDFILRSARWGHGIGMSQRGAQQMAGMGYTYDQILGFYYEGCERVQNTFTHTILPAIGSGNGTVTATEAPATIAPESTGTARISLTGVNDSVSLRFLPNAGSKVLVNILNGTSVQVVHHGASWTLIRYGVIQGYVPTSSLVINGTPPTDASASATNITQWAVVTGTNSLNFRDAAGTASNVIGSISGGAVLPVLSTSGSWAYVQYGLQTGYCSMDYMTMHTTWPGDTAVSGDSAMVSLPGESGSTPLYATASTNGTQLMQIGHGTQVTVLSNDGSWCRVQISGVTGYVLASALDFGATGVTPTQPPLAEGEQYAIVASDASTLNLRSGPSVNDAVIAEIPKGTRIVVTSYGAQWCAVRWGSLTGYVMTEYLSFDTGDDPTPTPGPTHVPEGAPALLTSNADLFTAASSSSEIQLLIPVGETVSVISYGETYSMVTYANLTGYVFTAVLQLYQDMQTPTQSPTATPTASPTPTPTATPTPSPTFEPISGVGIVLLNAQLRAEPDTSSAVLMTLPANTEVNVTLRSTSWCQVECAGTVGWMLTSQLHITVNEATATPTPTPTPTHTPTPTPTQTADPDPTDESIISQPEAASSGRQAWIVSTVTGVNLRAKAADTSEILCEIPANAYLTAYESTHSWTRVVYEGTSGYVYTRYITYADPADSLGTRYICTDTDPLALREGPSTSTKVITRIPRGTAVTLLQYGQEWCYIQYGANAGYCATRYLSVSKPANRVQDDTPLLDWTLADVTGWTGKINTTDGSSVFLRKWCSLEAPEITEVKADTAVTILRKGDVWCLVKVEGVEGYCLTSVLTLYAPAE